MQTLSFSEEDLRSIAHDRYHHPDPRVQQFILGHHDTAPLRTPPP